MGYEGGVRVGCVQARLATAGEIGKPGFVFFDEASYPVKGHMPIVCEKAIDHVAFPHAAFRYGLTCDLRGQLSGKRYALAPPGIEIRLARSIELGLVG